MVKHNRLVSSLLAAVLGFTYLILLWSSAILSYTVFLHFNSTNLQATQNVTTKDNQTMETNIEEEVIADEAEISLPSREEILQLYSEIEAEKNAPRTPSSFVLDAVTSINELQGVFESIERTIERNKELLKAQFSDLERNIEQSHSGKINHWQKEDTYANTVLNLSSLKNVLGTSSFSVFTESELESTFKEVKDFDKNLSKMMMKVDNYVEYFDLIEYLQKLQRNHHFTCTSQESSQALQQQQQSSKEMIEMWKKVATTSHFLSRGIEIEDALRERTEQYLSSSTFASPLTAHGTHEIHNYIESKAAETLEKFMFLDSHWEMLKSNRMTKIQVLDDKASFKDDNSCVDDVEEIQSAFMEIIHTLRITEASQLSRVGQNEVENFGLGPSLNLWWIIQSPLFYKCFSLLDEIVDSVSGYNEYLDHLIDSIMDMTSDISDLDYNDQIATESHHLLGHNLQRILKKKSHQTNFHVPEKVQPYLKKSGMLKNEVIKSIGKVVQLTSENNGKKILDIAQEAKYWIDDLLETSFEKLSDL